MDTVELVQKDFRDFIDTHRGRLPKHTLRPLSVWSEPDSLQKLLATFIEDGEAGNVNHLRVEVKGEEGRPTARTIPAAESVKGLSPQSVAKINLWLDSVLDSRRVAVVELLHFPQMPDVSVVRLLHKKLESNRIPVRSIDCSVLRYGVAGVELAQDHGCLCVEVRDTPDEGCVSTPDSYRVFPHFIHFKSGRRFHADEAMRFIFSSPKMGRLVLRLPEQLESGGRNDQGRMLEFVRDVCDRVTGDRMLTSLGICCSSTRVRWIRATHSTCLECWVSRWRPLCAMTVSGGEDWMLLDTGYSPLHSYYSLLDGCEWAVWRIRDTQVGGKYLKVMQKAGGGDVRASLAVHMQLVDDSDYRDRAGG